jgi:hypothetical protein
MGLWVPDRLGNGLSRVVTKGKTDLWLFSRWLKAYPAGLQGIECGEYVAIMMLISLFSAKARPF